MGMRKIGIVATLAAALMMVGAGCGGSDPNEAETPANAPTVSNAAEAPTDGGGEKPAEGGADAEAVAAGKAFYEGAGTCQGCHPAGGTEAGAGPKLAAAGLTAEGITKQIEAPMGAMPAGLATGDDLENVTAFLVSIQ